MRVRGLVTSGVAAALAAAAVLLTGCEQTGGDDPRQDPPTSAPSSSSAAPTVPTPTTTYSPAPRVFDHAAVQDAVHKVLTEYHQVEKLGVVSCPRDRLVKKGTRFNCTATIDGEKKKVPISVTSDDGNYKVGAPK